MRPFPRPALVAAVALLIGGCDALTNRPPLARDFGAPYAVRTGVVIDAAGAPEQPTPAVTLGGVLWTVVTYRGGCGSHTFTTESDGLSSGGSVVWLRHLTQGETCNRFLQDTLRIPLEGALRPYGETPALTLATPDGDELDLAWSATVD